MSIQGWSFYPLIPCHTPSELSSAHLAKVTSFRCFAFLLGGLQLEIDQQVIEVSNVRTVLHVEDKPVWLSGSGSLGSLTQESLIWLVVVVHLCSHPYLWECPRPRKDSLSWKIERCLCQSAFKHHGYCLWSTEGAQQGSVMPSPLQCHAPLSSVLRVRRGQ